MAHALTRKLEEADSPLVEDADELTRQIRKADRQTDALISGIIPVPMDEEGIGVALEKMARKVEQVYHVRCTVDLDPGLSIADNTTATRLYRIVQEATHNAIQHGNATEIRIQVTRDAGQLALRVTDNGEGFDEPADSLEECGMGMRLMKYRCDLIGGSLSIESRPDDGVEVSCVVSDEPPQDEVE